MGESPVTIVTYGLLTRNSHTAKALEKAADNFSTVILDESHYIKSMDSQRTTILQPVRILYSYCTRALYSPYCTLHTVLPILYSHCTHHTVLTLHSPYCTRALLALYQILRSARRRILLSGTPALGRPAELYPQIEAVSPNLLGDFRHFAYRY
jgi:SNF2 family DNA or RNA helicase